MRSGPKLLLCALALATAACTRHDVVDALVSSAYRDDGSRLGAGLPRDLKPRYEVLAGDMHCHVSPPDDRSDVDRGLAETLTLARKEKIDFVVLTPHVGARFFADWQSRLAVAESQARLRTDLDALGATDVLFIPGFEYTDHRFGHVGASFANLDDVLDAVPLDEAVVRPERFFEEWVARGGYLVVNHPLVTPVDSIIPIARADLSWRPMTGRGPFPTEIEAIDRLAQGFEAFNLAATQLRDRVLLDEPNLTLESTFAALDARIPIEHRRMVPVGGSDSHSHHLRATVFVLAEARTREAIHDALVAGRTCVRDRAACSFELRSESGGWLPVGSAVDEGGAFEARAVGDAIDVIVDGAVVASPASGETARLDLPRDRCSVVRARVGEGYSAPIYVHCFVS